MATKKTLASITNIKNIFVINLPHRTDNLTRFNKLADEAGIGEFKVFPAVIGKNLDLMKMVENKELTQRGLYSANYPWMKSHDWDLTSKGAVGCYLSHIGIAKLVVDKGLNGAIIFEDDCIFAHNFLEQFEEAFNELPSDFDFMHFGYNTFCKQHNPVKIDEVNYSPHLLTSKSCTMGFQGYLITNKCAKKLLQYAFPIEVQVDGYLSLLLINNIIFDNIDGKAIQYYATKNTLIWQHNTKTEIQLVGSNNYVDKSWYIPTIIFCIILIIIIYKI